MGGRAVSACVRDRRSDRHQGGRRHRRSRLRGALEAVYPRPGRKLIDGPLWASVRGAGSPTVVFEAGGGEDSSVWNELETEVRDRCEVRTMLYDRAGLGSSPPSSLPYRIDGEADALRLELDRHGITAPVVRVAHSYGGLVATIVA